MMMKFSAFFGLTAAAGLAAATVNVPREASPSCVSAINTILSSPEPGINCLAPGALNTIISEASKNATVEVLAGAIDHWLDEMCAVGFCSPETLEHVAANITAGCGTTFDGIALPSAIGLVTALKVDYPVIRDMMCLKNSNANKQYCMTELLSQSKVSLFDMTDPVVVVEELIFSAFNGDCNDCTRAAFGLSNALIPGLDGNALLTSMCGANFTASLSTTPPVGIIHSAVTFGFKNGARALALPAMATFVLSASVLFALL
ncbi:hypothetical protein B0H13DRAFT_1853949 [Mycena leptocephala]|nr:hypothetical protein B0H13DRAFT_1853949 [Mycena leptocephala]